MTTGIFGERRGLQYRVPIFIQNLVNQGLGADQITPVFFVPTTDKRIGYGKGGIGVGRYGGVNIGIAVTSYNFSDPDPMRTGTDLMFALKKILSLIHI